MLVISAWAWGSWAFIKDQVDLPVIGQDQFGANVYQSKPQYVSVFYSIWECVFFAVLFLFIEKFILQLIGKNKNETSKLMLRCFFFDSHFISQVTKRKKKHAHIVIWD